MSLSNETKTRKEQDDADSGLNSALARTKLFYKDYTSGMSREQFEHDIRSDRQRLRVLYEEAIGDPRDPKTGSDIGALEKSVRLITALGRRMNPTRRMLAGISVLCYISTFFFGGLVFSLLQPATFAVIFVILMLELLEKQDAKEEINLARDIQVSLLPASRIHHNGIAIESFANTAREVGGDYVDVLHTEKGSYYIIADVSGKGLSAALYMVRFQALVHLLVKNLNPSPKQLFLELNDFIKSYRRDKTFITACAAFFPHDKDEMHYVRAGHNPPVFFHGETERTELLQTPGFALGMTRTPRLEKFLEEKVMAFRPGDSLLFYTDGLNESRNMSGEEFGDTRIRSFMDVYGGLPPSSVVHKLQASLEHFIGDKPPLDDITFSCVSRERSAVPGDRGEEAEIISQETKQQKDETRQDAADDAPAHTD